MPPEILATHATPNSYLYYDTGLSSSTRFFGLLLTLRFGLRIPNIDTIFSLSLTLNAPPSVLIFLMFLPFTRNRLCLLCLFSPFVLLVLLLVGFSNLGLFHRHLCSLSPLNL